MTDRGANCLVETPCMACVHRMHGVSTRRPQNMNLPDYQQRRRCIVYLSGFNKIGMVKVGTIQYTGEYNVLLNSALSWRMAKTDYCCPNALYPPVQKWAKLLRSLSTTILKTG